MGVPLWGGAAKGAAIATATITASTDVLTIAGHTLAEGQQVIFDTPLGGAVGVIRPDVPYFVVNISGDNFQIAPSAGAPVMTFAADGSAIAYGIVGEYDASELRNTFAGMFTRSGSPSATYSRPGVMPLSTAPLSITGGGATCELPTMHVNVRHSSGNSLFVRHGGETLTIPAADSQDRIDAVDIRVYVNDLDTSGRVESDAVYVTGTPAGSPSAPTVTADSTRIGTIRVPANGASTPFITGSPTYTTMAGGILVISGTTQRPSTPHIGQTVLRTDTLAHEYWTGTAWEPVVPVRGWVSVGSGDRAGATGLFDIDVTAGGKYPAGTFSRLRLVLMGDLEATGVVALRVNAQATGYISGLTARDMTDNLDVATHGGTETYWRIASWGTVSSNVCEAVIYGTQDTTLTCMSTGSRSSATASVHNYSMSWGGVTASALVASLRVMPISAANTWGDELHWELEGYRP
jgi:hypothetical protein